MKENNIQKENAWKHITDRHCYRFKERITQGLNKVPKLKITRLTIRQVETEDTEIALDVVELGFLAPVFMKFIELRDFEQNERIQKMKEFIESLE